MSERYAYLVTIREEDQTLLHWLAARGYDGNFLDLAHQCAERLFGMHEHEAWEFMDYVNDDPDAFLTCCGSPTLASALQSLLWRIV